MRDHDQTLSGRPDRPPRRRVTARTGMIEGTNPTTCEPDYDGDELEFMTAVDRYRREHRRPFPTCCEVLAVLKSLGYRKTAAPLPLPRPGVRAVPSGSDGGGR